MLGLIRKARSIFHAVGPARRALASVRTPFYALRGALRPAETPPISDRSQPDTEQLNRASDKYFDVPERRRSWLSKPLSEGYAGPDNLWRFGFLLSALQIRAEDRVLDLGCGTGWTTALVATIGAEATGVDISARAIDIARGGYVSNATPGRLRFESYNGHTIDAPDGYFDFVILFDALHHIPNPVAILSEIFRVLGPHGVVGFAEPGLGHSSSVTALQEASLDIQEGEVDPEQLRRTARAIGFNELELLVPPIVPRILTLPMPRAKWYLRGIPWIVPHDYIRTSMLTSPIGVIRKGPYSATSLHPHTLRALIRPAASEIRALPSQPSVLAVTVRNTAGTVWLRDGRRGVGAVSLLARLEDPSLPADTERRVCVPIPHDMREGDDCVLTVRMDAPSRPGRYLIRLDMLTEGIGAFGERGSEERVVHLLVHPTDAP